MTRLAFILLALLSLCPIGRGQTTKPAEPDDGDAPLAPTTQPSTQPYKQVRDIPRPGRVAPLPRPNPAIEHVLIVSIDGMRPDVLFRADMPNVHRLYQSGAFSFWARTTALSITLPSHTTMLTGVSPRRHEIEWNKDLPLEHPVYPRVMTLFEAAHRAGLSTGLAAGKSKFDTLDVPGSIDHAWYPEQETVRDAVVAEHAADIVRAYKPQVMFVHFPSVDNVGHKKGWGTPLQLAAAARADAALGWVLAALDEAGMTSSTFILVTADHGGAARTHGPDDMRSRNIPWIAVGPGVQRNVDLTTVPKLDINTEDTFATACWLMGIPVPTKDIDGKPITQVFAQTGELLRPTTQEVTATSALEDHLSASGQSPTTAPTSSAAQP